MIMKLLKRLKFLIHRKIIRVSDSDSVGFYLVPE